VNVISNKDDGKGECASLKTFDFLLDMCYKMRAHVKHYGIFKLILNYDAHMKKNVSDNFR
jgi:hypothetical protein